MKNIFKILFASVLGIFLMVSCDRTDDLAVLDFKSNPELDGASFTSATYVITADNLANTFETIIFKKPVFTQETAVESQLEIALAGTNFAKPVSLGTTTNDDYVKVLYSQLNTALLSLGVDAVEPQNVEIRVKSNIKTRPGRLADPALYSNHIAIVVTPYIDGPTYLYTDLYLIGSATAAEWDNSAGNAKMYPLLKTANLPDIYSYTGYFKGGEDVAFKIIKEKGSWDVQYGLGDAAGKLSQDGGSGNIPVPASGYYELTINTTELTYTLTPISAPTTTYATVGIIGTATEQEWAASTPMVQSTFDPHVWVLTNVTLKEGEVKFRANNAWDVSWGSKNEYFGTGALGGDNIPVSVTWTYDIYFNDATGAYSIIPSK